MAMQQRNSSEWMRGCDPTAKNDPSVPHLPAGDCTINCQHFEVRHFHGQVMWSNFKKSSDRMKFEARAAAQMRARDNMQ